MVALCVHEALSNKLCSLFRNRYFVNMLYLFHDIVWITLQSCKPILCVLYLLCLATLFSLLPPACGCPGNLLHRLCAANHWHGDICRHSQIHRTTVKRGSGQMCLLQQHVHSKQLPVCSEFGPKKRWNL